VERGRAEQRRKRRPFQMIGAANVKDNSLWMKNIKERK